MSGPEELRALVEEVRAGLEGVTPGPWNVEYGESGNGPDRHSYALLMRTEDEWPTGIETGDVHCIDGSPLMEHIARCSPENIAALLDHIEALALERDNYKTIAESDDVDNALDPARNKRVARAALAKEDGR